MCSPERNIRSSINFVRSTHPFERFSPYLITIELLALTDLVSSGYAVHCLMNYLTVETEHPRLRLDTEFYSS